jgi:hypothetical protein
VKVTPFMGAHFCHLVRVNERTEIGGIDDAGNQIVPRLHGDLEPELFQGLKISGITHKDRDRRRKPLLRLSIFVLPHMPDEMMVKARHSDWNSSSRA